MATKIEKIDDSSYPLIVSFPQGVPNDFDDLKIRSSIKKIKTKNNNQNKDNNSEVIVIAEGAKRIVYKGDSSVDNDFSKYAIGVVNKKSGKMSIIKTDHVFSLRPQFNNINTTQPRNSLLNNLERRQSLTEEFGSRKKKRALQAAQSNQIKVENISGASTIENILTSKSPSLRNELLEAAEQALKNKSRKSKRK